ncbi:MAG: hypothetical protein EZS28_042386 [Streblomastix strix]|uniref:Uncharacterized protein n=1 Tax=Streblomastix strix TaxID=222440 RepID=A0A5J4TUX9_9EUKA|nr:MAG: hypothetical protein EZS28_042386 [Streblomastix strix]
MLKYTLKNITQVRSELFPQDVENYQKYVSLRVKSRPCFDLYENVQFKERFFGCAMIKIQEMILVIVKLHLMMRSFTISTQRLPTLKNKKIEVEKPADEDQKAYAHQVKAGDEVILIEKPLMLQSEIC